MCEAEIITSQLIKYGCTCLRVFERKREKLAVLALNRSSKDIEANPFKING